MQNERVIPPLETARERNEEERQKNNSEGGIRTEALGETFGQAPGQTSGQAPGQTQNWLPAADLKQLETQRRRVQWAKWIMIALFLIAWVPLALWIQKITGWSSRGIRYLALPIIWWLYGMYRKREGAYLAAVDRLVSGHIVSRLRPTWRMLEEQAVTPALVFDSTLVKKRPYARTAATVAGEIRDVTFCYTHVETSTRNALAARLPKVDFRGYFFIFQFPKQVPSPLQVRPRGAKDFGSLMTGATQQKTDAAEFDGAFAAYCDDPVGMRYVLSLALMARMIDLQRVLPGCVSFLFTGNKVCIALKMKGSTIEPKVNRRLDLERMEMAHEELFSLIERFITELRLEMDIWKEAEA